MDRHRFGQGCSAREREWVGESDQPRVFLVTAVNVGEAGPRFSDHGRRKALVSTVLAAADAGGDDDPTPVRVPMSQLLDRATRRINNPQARTRVETASYGDPAVTTVPDYIVTALALVIDDALKFSPDDQPVVVIARSPADRLEFEVRDRGPGIDPADVTRLFEPFTQADQSTTRTTPGLGIGLYTSQKLIARLGGEIVLGRHPEGGTVARITVPSSGHEHS